MMDLRPIFYVLGRILLALGAFMLVPALVDWRAEGLVTSAFLQSAIITAGIGGMVSLATGNALGRGLDARAAYLLTVLIWGLVPFFGALPLMLGAPGLGLTDGYFEAVSGITTTGSTVIYGLDDLPVGTNLWRGMLNWLGGLGIAFVAMIFLPVMRVGGMQFFRTEGFDTFGKILPRASDIARQLVMIYAGLTLVCMLTYAALGMPPLVAVVHGMATIATGGFSPSDRSFSDYAGAAEYAGAIFMILGSLPYIRYVQLVNGAPKPLWVDAQVRAYLRWLAMAVLSVTLWRVLSANVPLEPAFRMTLFNLTSIMSSTGFFSGDFSGWGGFMLVVAFVIGVVGACSGSSAAGLSVFRVQIAVAAIRQQVRQIISPSLVAPVRYEGRVVEDDVLYALVLYVTGYILTLGVLSIGMALVGVDLESAIFGVWTSIGNVGYGFGPMVARTGTFVDFPTAAKWIMILAMLMGRLGLLALFVLALPRFWQR